MSEKIMDKSCVIEIFTDCKTVVPLIVSALLSLVVSHIYFVCSNRELFINKMTQVLVKYSRDSISKSELASISDYAELKYMLPHERTIILKMSNMIKLNKISAADEMKVALLEYIDSVINNKGLKSEYERVFEDNDDEIRYMDIIPDLNDFYHEVELWVDVYFDKGYRDIVALEKKMTSVFSSYAQKIWNDTGLFGSIDIEKIVESSKIHQKNKKNYQEENDSIKEFMNLRICRKVLKMYRS